MFSTSFYFQIVYLFQRIFFAITPRDNESSAVSTDSSLWNNDGESVASHLDKPLPPTRSSSSSSDPFSEKPSSSEAAIPPFVSQISVASVASDSFAAKTGLAVRDATIPDLDVKEKWCPVYVTFAKTPAKFYVSCYFEFIKFTEE